MWVPLKEKEKINKKGMGGRTDGRERGGERERILKKISLFVSFPDLRKSDRRILSGKGRKVLYATRATREYQKHRISPRIQVKIQKILNFLFFSDLRRSNSQNFSNQN